MFKSVTHTFMESSCEGHLNSMTNGRQFLFQYTEIPLMIEDHGDECFSFIIQPNDDEIGYRHNDNRGSCVITFL